MKDVLFNGILLLEGKDGHKCWEYLKNCTPYDLSIDNFVHLKLTNIPNGIYCFVCGKKKEVATMLSYNQCQHR